jgi:hypothetical protein
LHPTDGGQAVSLALYADKKEEWHTWAGSYNRLSDQRSSDIYYPFHQLALKYL